MVYNTDENGYVLNYATVGGVENGVAYDGPVPEGFADCPWAYRVEGGVLTPDAERLAALTAPEPEPEPGPTVAELQQRVEELETVIDVLIGGEV